MTVVDVNIVAYLLINGDKTTLAQKVYHKDPTWRLPYLWRHEFLNVLATYCRQGGVAFEQAEQIWYQAVTAFAPGGQESNMPLALHIASQHQISAYDAQYVALAIELGAFCISEDHHLQRAFPQLVLSMEQFLTASH